MCNLRRPPTISPIPAGESESLTAIPSGGDRAPDTPSNYIPGLVTLGSTYNVLNGKYADSKSALQQVIDWNKSEVPTQPLTIISYGKRFRVHQEPVVHAGFEASFPGFSASASADYSESQRESLSNSFTRITFSVTHYNLSLPLRARFGAAEAVVCRRPQNMDPIEFTGSMALIYSALDCWRSALFLNSTDTRNTAPSVYRSCRQDSASYLLRRQYGSFRSQKQAMESFNESSNTSVATKGGDPRYGTKSFEECRAWAASIVDYPEFVDFGSLPCFVGLWELTTNQTRQKQLKDGYAQFVKLYTQICRFLVRTWKPVDMKAHYCSLSPTRSDGFYLITLQFKHPQYHRQGACPGALAPVKWEEAFVGPYYSDSVTRVWRAIPPTSDYVALGFVSMTRKSIGDIPAQPPASLAGSFRAIHKLALTGAAVGAHAVFHSSGNRVVYWVDYRYWYADIEVPEKSDCYVLDPKMTIKNWSGW
ncbi:hypothetical protein BC629DRAFT_1596249 [Irpex lacteus]|nr:hypothetical protein BC629DRAFT_1596249 [Irpex lacteus]